MIVLVSGGASSGKSEFAESAVTALSKKLVYLATMQVNDKESEKRVDRHRKLREGKGFITCECPVHIENALIPEGHSVLLECLSNLTANECFGDEGMEGAEERVIRGILSLSKKAKNLVIVSNEIFSDAIRYDEYTTNNMKILSHLNCRIAEIADAVVEVSVTVPHFWKGDAECIFGKHA